MVVGFSKSSLKTAINHLIENCCFNDGNFTIKQTTGIPMRIEPASVWANPFLYSYEQKYMSSQISSDKIKKKHCAL